LFPRAILRAEYEADHPFHEAMKIRRERLQAKRAAIALRLAQAGIRHVGGPKLQIHLHGQPSLGLAYDFWLLCKSSYLLFVWVANAIPFEHIASNPFCVPAEIPRLRCGVLSFSVMFVFQIHSCTLRQRWFRDTRQ
jgi:hypothetical protein